MGIVDHFPSALPPTSSLHASTLGMPKKESDLPDVPFSDDMASNGMDVIDGEAQASDASLGDAVEEDAKVLEAKRHARNLELWHHVVWEAKVCVCAFMIRVCSSQSRLSSWKYYMIYLTGICTARRACVKSCVSTMPGPKRVSLLYGERYRSDKIKRKTPIGIWVHLSPCETWQASSSRQADIFGSDLPQSCPNALQRIHGDCHDRVGNESE